jgi:cell division protein FtsQ
VPKLQGSTKKMEKRKFQVYSLGQQELVVKRKEEKIIKGKLLFVLLFVIVTLALILFLRFPLFSIREISIAGGDQVFKEDLRVAMGLKEGINIWKISPPKLKESILQLPRISNVEVERVLPDKLLITVEEKYPVAMMPYHDYFLELADDGFIIGIKNDYKGELPLLNGMPYGKMDLGSRVTDFSRGEIIGVFLEALYAMPALPVAEINVENPQQIIIYTREGMEVRLGNKNHLEDKLKVLEKIYYRLLLLEDNNLENKAGYLDLRTAEAPVFKKMEK